MKVEGSKFSGAAEVFKNLAPGDVLRPFNEDDFYIKSDCSEVFGTLALNMRTGVVISPRGSMLIYAHPNARVVLGDCEG